MPLFPPSTGGDPGGSDTQVQFNDAGAFGGDAGLVFNKTTNALTAGQVTSSEGYGLSRGTTPYWDLEETDTGNFGGMYLSADKLRFYHDNGVGVLTFDGTTLGIAGITLNGALIPDTNDGYNLGSSTKAWAGLYLGPDEVIYFNNITYIYQGVGADNSLYLTAPAGHYVRIRDATSGLEAILDATAIASTDKTFTFPNATGTFIVAPPNGNSNTDISVDSGDAISGNNGGGALNLRAGDGFGSGTGGLVQLYSGDAGATGTGGSMIIAAGDATSGNAGDTTISAGGVSTGTGVGGDLSLNAGTGGSTAGNAGWVNITAGDAAGGNSNGGTVSINSGSKTGSGVAGSIDLYSEGIINLRSGGGSIDAILSTADLATSNKTFTFPNTTGTLGLKNQEITVYGAGTAYSLTNTAVAIDFGTTDPAITLNAAGTYLIFGQVNLAYTGATVVAETATIKVRRTNNTATDLSSVVVLDLPASTVVTNTYGIFQIPPFVYTTTVTDDAVTLFANVSATLGAGTIDATAIGTSLVAIRLY